jgi:hypothetical protein
MRRRDPARLNPDRARRCAAVFFAGRFFCNSVLLKNPLHIHTDQVDIQIMSIESV